MKKYADSGLLLSEVFLTFMCPRGMGMIRPPSLVARYSSIPIKIMKNLERITLMTATAVYAGYLIKQAIRTRAERVYRLAAGESPYERTHPKPRAVKKVMA